MNKGLKGVCAAALSLTLLTTTLTACGKKITANANPQAYNNAPSGSYSDGSINNVVPSDGGNNVEIPNSNSDSGVINYNNSSGNYSSGNYSSGNSYTPSVQGGTNPELPSPAITDNSGTTSATKKSSIFNRITRRERTTTVKTTTASTSKTKRENSAREVDVPKVLNSAPLNPVLTNDAEVDQLAANILASVTTSNMTTYQKVTAIYDHLVQNYRYGYMPFKNYESPYRSPYDAEVVARAKNFMKYKTGICIDFAAAFMVLTRRIGLNCYLVSGQIINRYGEYSFHGWNVMRINGVDYGFDSEADFRFSTGGPTKFYTFCIDDPVKFDKNLTNSFVVLYGGFRTF